MIRKRSGWIVWRYVREERWVNAYLQPDGSWGRERDTAAEFDTMQDGIDAGRAANDSSDGIDVALRVYDEQPRKSWWRRLTG